MSISTPFSYLNLICHWSSLNNVNQWIFNRYHVVGLFGFEGLCNNEWVKGFNNSQWTTKTKQIWANLRSSAKSLDKSHSTHLLTSSTSPYFISDQIRISAQVQITTLIATKNQNCSAIHRSSNNNDWIVNTYQEGQTTSGRTNVRHGLTKTASSENGCTSISWSINQSIVWNWGIGTRLGDVWDHVYDGWWMWDEINYIDQSQQIRSQQCHLYQSKHIQSQSRNSITTHSTAHPTSRSAQVSNAKMWQTDFTNSSA